MRLDGQTTVDAGEHEVRITKVLSAGLYGKYHDGKLTSALLFASKHHQHQIRKASGEPYINHLLEVLNLLAHFEPECDESTRMAAVLHDVVEDTPVTIESVEFLFGSDVATLVSHLTCVYVKDSEDKKVKLLQQITLADTRSKQIKLADVTSNVMLIPAQWSIKKRQSYLLWCTDVAEICAHSSEGLYANFIAKLR
jgi:(p)ppGpp synthase/HD superfamily hydrolase